MRKFKFPGSDSDADSIEFEVPHIDPPLDWTGNASGDACEIFRGGSQPGSRGYSAPAPAANTPKTGLALPSLPSGLSVSADKQTVVILDVGMGSDIGNLIYQYDFYSGDSSARNTSASNHGSLVASQVLAADGEANIVILKVAADGSDSISLEAVDTALDWVVANAKALNVAAVNLSFGASATTTTATTTSLSDEFASLKTLDVAVVVAAGNAGAKAGVSAIAADVNAIAVSASDGAGAFASFSNRDVDLTDLVADGVDIATAAGKVSGTSFSAPLVAGAIAEVKAEFFATYGREASVGEALLLLQKTGDAMSTGGEVAAASGSYGSGYAQLDLESALAAIHSPTQLALIGISPAAAA